MKNTISKYIIKRDECLEIIKNNIFVFYLIFYISGPAFINVFITLLSIFSLYLIFKHRSIKLDISKITFAIFIFYIPIKDIIINGINFDYLSLLRFALIIFTIEHYRFFNFNQKPVIFIVIILLIDGLFQYMFGVNILSFPLIENYRITSLFRDEPIYGGFLVKLFFPILFIFLSYENKKYLLITLPLILI